MLPFDGARPLNAVAYTEVLRVALHHFLVELFARLDDFLNDVRDVALVVSSKRYELVDDQVFRTDCRQRFAALREYLPLLERLPFEGRVRDPTLA